MADLLPTLLSFPPEKEVSNKEYDKQATKYVESLNKISESAWTKPVNKQNILDLLNPATNSIPYLYALYAQWRNASKDRTRNEDAMTRAFIFFTSFDPVQVRYAGDTWLRLLDQAIDITPKLGVTDFTPITTAMLRLDPTAGTFTSLHLRLVRMCLAEGAPSQALPILDKNIYGFPQAPHKNLPDELLCEDHELSNSFITTKTGFSITPLKSEWILEYYLLGADIYIGLRNYSRARLFLEYLLLTPTSQHSCSALQMEAYKKWTLLGLLAQGKSFPLPRTHNQQVMKSMKAIGKSYDALAESFEKRQWRKFRAEMEAGFHIWQEDGNLRLVREVADALMRYLVLDLQNTYAALTVGRVASHLSLSADETFTILTAMREQGYLHARITASSNDSASDTAVLHFHPTTESADEDSLQNRTTRIESLISFLRDADRRLQLTKEYIEVQKRGKRGGAGPDGDLAEQMDLTWDDAPIPGMGDGEGDEDIMAG